MANRLSGKTIFTTAAGAGIGRATALMMAAEGARVIATDRDVGLLADLKPHGIEVEALDALDNTAIKAAAKKHGAVDVLFNCAGVVHQGTVLDATDEQWSLAFDLNARATFHTIQAFLPAMLDAGGGSIVNIASVVSTLKGAPNRFIYAASKAAVLGLTRAVAADYVTRGIRCNAVCPGTVQSPSLDTRIAANAAAAGGMEAARAAFVARQPMGRVGLAEEIAAMVVYLASDESRFVTGQAMVIDGGFSL